MPVSNLPAGPIHHRILGPDDPGAPTVVFVHGFLVNSTLWDGAAEQLVERGVRCVLPDLPLGAHRHPCPDGDLSPAGQAEIVRSFLVELDLHDVTLVGNDSGGAICQLLLAGGRDRVRAVTFTNCDAFEAFPPAPFSQLFRLARRRRLIRPLLFPTRWTPVRHSPLGFGMLLGAPRDAALTRGWVDPALDDPAIRDDIARFARGWTGDELRDAGSWLSSFSGPVRLVWGTADRFFTEELGDRLRAAFTGSDDVRMERLAGHRTFVPVEAPAAVADVVAEVAAPTPTPSDLA